MLYNELLWVILINQYLLSVTQYCQCVLQGILYDNVICSLTVDDSHLHCTGVTVGLCNVVSDASTLMPSEMPGLVWMSGIEARIHKDQQLIECIISALDSLKGTFSVTATIYVCVLSAAAAH